MATLKNRHKAFITIRLACYESPTDVVEAVQEEFGIEVSRSQVAYYDPTGVFYTILPCLS